MEKIPLVGFILVIVAFVLDLVFSYGTMWWYYKKTTSGSTTTKSYLGIWRVCSTVEVGSSSTDTCYFHTDDNFPQDRKYIGSTQVFQTLGELLLVGSIIFAVLALFVPKTKGHPALIPLAAAHALWGSLCLIGSTGSFGRGIEDQSSLSTSDLHFSFAFAVIAGIVGLIGGIVLVVACFKGNSQSSPKA